MPKFKITDEQTGRSTIVSGDTQPTEQESEEIFRASGFRDITQQAAPEIPQPLISPPEQPEPEQPQGILSTLSQIGKTVNPIEFFGSAIADKDSLPRKIVTGKEAQQLVRNIPSSAGKFATDLFTALRHPVETTKSIGKLLGGTIELSIPGEQGLEPFARSFGGFLQERYGGFDEFKKTLIEDPIGVAGDFSTFLTGVGGTIGITGKVSKTAQLSKVGKVLTDVAKIAEPIQASRNILRTSLGFITPQGLPKSIFGRILKLPVKTSQTDRARIVETGLREGFVPTKSNLTELDSLITQITNEVDDAVVGAAKRGEEVNMIRVFEAFNELQDFYKNIDTPAEFIESIANYKNSILQQRGAKLTPQQANILKRNTQTLVRKHFGEMKGIQTEMRKALAFGLRTEIEKLNPEIGTLNKRASELIELDKALNNAVGRISNQQLIGLKEQIATIGAIQAESPTTRRGFLAFLAGDLLINNPKLNAKLAIALEKARKQPVRTGSTLGLLGRQSIFQAGREERRQQQSPQNIFGLEAGP